MAGLVTGGPDLVDSLDGVSYVLTAPRCQITWEVWKGNRTAIERKRVKRGQVIKGVPEYNLRKLVDMGYAVPEQEYDPEALEAERTRRRLMYDQGAARTAQVEWAMAQARKQKTVGLEDAAPRLTDSGREIDGIPIEDVDPDVGASDDDDDLGLVPASAGTEPEDYKSMDYPALQKYAKDTTGNGAGGKEELIARLDEHFEQ